MHNAIKTKHFLNCSMNIIRAEIKKKKGGGREAVSFSNRTMVLTTDRMKPEPQEEHKKFILHL